MKTLFFVVIILYALFLLFIFLYSLIQLNLSIIYKRARKNKEFNHSIEEKTLGFYPMVTIQLPVFNEKYVVESVLDAVSKFDYPKDKLEIQLLDDSTDESLEIGLNKVEYLKEKGFYINQIIRENRKGYKAGALDYGLKIAKGEFIAIFDADFIPSPGFLKSTLPFFNDKKIGVVQSRWTHLNKDYSTLTRLQAFGLDVHFTVEQGARNIGNHFINFNGTAGVWRKECIENAGGWSADTLTEDLDLSYRAQLKGWKFKFLENVESPAELPVTVTALKSQQFRWTKGAAECAKKNLGKVINAKEITTKTKVHAFFHLLNSSIFLAILSVSLLSIPLLLLKQDFKSLDFLFHWASLFLTSFIILGFFYWLSYQNDKVESSQKKFLKFIKEFPLFLSVSMGLSFHNSIAVLEGLLGKKSAFIRTPKFNVLSKNDSWGNNKYRLNKINIQTFIELILVLYFLIGIVLAFYFFDFTLLPFHLMLFFGFGFIVFYSIKHSAQKIK